LSLTDQLIRDAERVAEHRKISMSRLATIVVNDGKFFGALKNGGTCTVRTYEAATAKLRALEPELFASAA